MNNEIALNDIADELLILNKYTIDTLFKLDNCTDCIALYVFYYKTAKWQKTNTIKANDTYVKKSLKWGEDKIRRTKKTLKENGLIEIVQSRKDGKINGWYIKISYLVKQKNIDDIKVKVETSNNTQNQELANSRSSIKEINALKEYIKCLEKEIEMLKNKNNVVNDIYTPQIKEVIDYLNEKTNKNFRATTKKTQTLIKGLLKNNYTVEDIKKVIDIKVKQWSKDKKMKIYLRPETLFGSKFEAYLNEEPNKEIYKIKIDHEDLEQYSNIEIDF